MAWLARRLQDSAAAVSSPCANASPFDAHGSPKGPLDKQRNQPSHPALSSLFQGGLVMDRDDPEQAADRHARAAVMAIFAVILAVAIMAAFITTLEDIDTRHAGDVTQPGTIGLAKPHPPLDRAPGEPVRD